MKKITLLFIAIGLIAITATTRISKASIIEKNNATFKVIDSKYKAMIEACNNCAASCKKCEIRCTKENAVKMARCIQLCKESAIACKASCELMKLNSENAKEMCLVCANICDKCALECEKMDMEQCKKCAADCRKAAKMCREM